MNVTSSSVSGNVAYSTMKPVYMHGGFVGSSTERRSRRKARERGAKLPPQSPPDFSALALLYCLALPTKTAMLRRLYQLLFKTESLDNAILKLWLAMLSKYGNYTRLLKIKNKPKIGCFYK